MKLTVSEKGVFLDGHEIPQCTQVDLKNISPVDGMEAVLHVDISEADVQWVGPKLFDKADKSKVETGNAYYRCGLRKWNSFPLISRCSLLVSLMALIISWITQCTTG